MNKLDPWYFLRSGQMERGIRQIVRRCEKNWNPSHLMEVGVAYMFVREYEKAFLHFQNALETFPQPMTNFYAMTGTALWCLGRPVLAADQWRAGLKAGFTDAAGLGIELPLLLFFASVLCPESSDSCSVTKLLKEKTSDPRIKIWPGPIVPRVVRMTRSIDIEGSIKPKDESERRDRHWFADFYLAVLALADGRRVEFIERMRELSDTSGPEWNDDSFFARIWGGEFFLARYYSSEKYELGHANHSTRS